MNQNRDMDSSDDLHSLEVFEDDMRASIAAERRLLWKELAALLAVAAVIVCRSIWLG